MKKINKGDKVIINIQNDQFHSEIVSQYPDGTALVEITEADYNNYFEAIFKINPLLVPEGIIRWSFNKDHILTILGRTKISYGHYS